MNQLVNFHCPQNANIQNPTNKHQSLNAGTAAPLQPFCTSLYPIEYICNCFNLIIYIVLDGPPASVTCGQFLNDNDVKDMLHRTMLLIG